MSTTPDLEPFDSIRLFWTDINGVARGISIPTDQFNHAVEDGIGFANGIAELTLEPGLLDNPKYGPESGDMMAVADPNSLMPVDWHNSEAVVFSDLTTVDGQSLDICPRSVLRDVLAELEREGYIPYVGVETEFSLLRSVDGEWTPFNTRCSYDMSAVDQATEHFSEWTTAMDAAGYKVLGIHQESQPGQYEVNIEYDDALTTADGIMFFRHMITSLARQHDLKVSLMPRPHTGEDANGMHLHLSLWDIAGERNLFGSDDGDIEFPAGKHPENAGISDDARYFIGGLLDHMKALTAVCAPTVNSYKRLLPGIWAPVNIAWGPDNRSTVLRLPPELGQATRIEHRVPDTASNPYLALAATLTAGLDGIRNETDPGPPTVQNAYNQDYESLPRTLWEALNHLEANETLDEALGESLIEEFVKIKRDEFNRYQDYVTDWERDEYLNEF